MPIRLGHLYDALRAAQGVAEDAARAAAEEVADYERQMADLRSDLRVIKVMLTALLGVTVAILVRVYFPT